MDFEQKLNKYLLTQNNEMAKFHKPLADNEFFVTQVAMCPRLMFLIKKFGYKYNQDISKFFQVGNIFHKFIQDNIFDKDIEQEASCIIKDKGLLIRGRIDGLTKDSIIELKSCSYLPKLPDGKYIQQLNLYLSQHKEKKGHLIYVSKFNLNSLQFDFEFDQELYDISLRKFKKVHNYFKSNELPPVEEPTHENSGFDCNCTEIYEKEIKKEGYK